MTDPSEKEKRSCVSPEGPRTGYAKLKGKGEEKCVSG